MIDDLRLTIYDLGLTTDKKMKRIFALIISVLCLVGAYGAKENTVGYVDMAYILKNLPQYETATEQLTMIAKRWQKEVDALEQEIRVMTTNYQTEQIFLSEDMRTRREEEILQKEKEAIELKRKYFGESGELVKKREALLKPIQDEIYAAIQELANDKHIDVIKDRSSDPGLLYMSSKLDYSDQLLQKLGAK